MTELKVGDLVKVTDGSYSVRADKFVDDHRSAHGLAKRNEPFEVIKVTETPDHIILRDDGLPCIHDIFIQSTTRKDIYLHSSVFVKKIERKISKKGK